MRVPSPYFHLKVVPVSCGPRKEATNTYVQHGHTGCRAVSPGPKQGATHALESSCIPGAIPTRPVASMSAVEDPRRSAHDEFGLLHREEPVLVLF